MNHWQQICVQRERNRKRRVVCNTLGIIIASVCTAGFVACVLEAIFG